MKDKNTNTNNGFSTPNAYFKQSKDFILKSIASISIEETIDKNGSITPPQYFSDSKKAILNNTIYSKTSITHFKKWIFAGLAVAASISLFFVVLNPKNIQDTPNNTIVYIDTLKNNIPTNFLKDSANISNEKLLSIYIDDSYTEESLDNYALESLVF